MPGLTRAPTDRPGREVGTALGHSVSIQYASVAVMLGLGALTPWLLLAGYSIRQLSAQVILSLTGHLRARPDPWLEGTLRAAFAEFDRELALILQDRTARPHHPDH
jgi:hypothetical protein